MKAILLVVALFLLPLCGTAQKALSPFERSGRQGSATYEECISFYKKLEATTGKLRVDSTGLTDAGTPLYTIIFPVSRSWDTSGITLLINNGIHPGEPDGIDASMLLLRDLAEGRYSIPGNLRLVVIPVYNVGGALNRNHSTRVNQNGPLEYGFRGNAQDLDLNRDFIKNDSRNARIFRQIFHRYDPEIFIDNHVSDGADYQHTLTLLSSQYDKLGGSLGRYFRNVLDPQLYRNMKAAGWPMVPYVNVEDNIPDSGWVGFYDPPRYSSGYAALFQCIAWVPETHMLKPYPARVAATEQFMKQVFALAATEARTIKNLRWQDRAELLQATRIPLAWYPSGRSMWPFLGYTAAYKQSEVTGFQRLYYDHSRPTNIMVPITDHYQPKQWVSVPHAYIIPQGWHRVISRILENRRIDYELLDRDTTIAVSAYHIDSFQTLNKPYEGHYKHYQIAATPTKQLLKFRKGDYLFPTQQLARRFLVESLEPTGEDAYFAWNFFDAILQRKEGYSDYRWEDVAAEELKHNPALAKALAEQRRKDPLFAKDAAAQLYFVYEHSRWMEPEFRRYPVFRIE